MKVWLKERHPVLGWGGTVNLGLLNINEMFNEVGKLGFISPRRRGARAKTGVTAKPRADQDP